MIAMKPLVLHVTDIPVRIESEMNRRDFGVDRWRRFNAQKNALIYSLGASNELRVTRRMIADRIAEGASVEVLLNRAAPRRLDDDNLASGFKGVRDEIALLLGIDDGDARVKWSYYQRKARHYAIDVYIEVKGE